MEAGPKLPPPARRLVAGPCKTDGQAEARPVPTGRVGAEPRQARRPAVRAREPLPLAVPAAELPLEAETGP